MSTVDFNSVTNPYYPIETRLLNPTISGLAAGDDQKQQHFKLKKMPPRAATFARSNAHTLPVAGAGGGSRPWGKTTNLKTISRTSSGFGLGLQRQLPTDRRTQPTVSPLPQSGSRRDFLKNHVVNKQTKRDAIPFGGVKLLDSDELPNLPQSRKKAKIDHSEDKGKKAVPSTPTTPVHSHCWG